MVSVPSTLFWNCWRATLCGLRVRCAACIAFCTTEGSSVIFSPQHVEHLRLGRHDLARPHGTGDQVGHSRAPLDGRDLGRILERGLDAGIQLADAREHDAGLAERRQNGFDVLQERRRRPDDEHARAAQPVAVRIEQVGGAMQGDGGLACARAALHDQHAGDLRADDAVLLRLDGRHDVGHSTGALGSEGGQQRALALQFGLLVRQECRVEHLVFDADDVAALGREVAAGSGAQRGCRGRLVERARLGHTPVEQDRLLVGIPEADAADVAMHAAEQFEATEGQPVLDLAELGDAILVQPGERIPLGASLVGAADRAALHTLELLAGVVAQGVEPRIEAVNVVAFAVDLG